jgi:dihydrofolate synthase / folylpolyglutamate synthase
MPGFFMMMADNYTYEECLRTMFGLRRFGIKLGLSTIRRILNELGNPHRSFQSIHVAGTNGKGSIASTLATILHASGYKVGLYTSPHLVRFNERICINNKPISNRNVVAAYRAVNALQHGSREPTFFEYSTAMAFYEFAKRRVDWAVIETGMGGRLDATNIIESAISIITNISLEHRTYLGNTLAEIAREKAGIIKKGRPVVTGVEQPSVWAAIEEIARERSAPVFRLGDAFRARRQRNGTFTYYGLENTWRGLHNGLQGNHQVDNSALVLAACEILNKAGANISLDHIRHGLEKNVWPGRLEVVSESPRVLLDGAHNLIAAKNLGKYLSSNLGGRRTTLVVGILDDKPYVSMLKSLVPPCDRVVLTRAKIDRALPPEVLLHATRKLISNINVIPDVGEAVRYAIDTSQKDDAVCIAGSLYVVGEAKEYFEKSGIAR